jgi:hypothetical protein
VEVTFDIDLPAMTESIAWSNGKEGEVEASVSRAVAHELQKVDEFTFWRFADAKATPSERSACSISLVAQGVDMADLQMKCGPVGDTVTITETLWEPSVFGAGCAKPVEEIGRTLPDEIMSRLLSQQNRPRFLKWLQERVPIASEGRWYNDRQRFLLPLDPALRCSEFKLHCWLNRESAEFDAKGVGREEPYQLGEAETRRAVVARLNWLYHPRGDKVPVDGSSVMIDTERFELKDHLQVSAVHLKKYETCLSQLMTVHEAR